ncbi:MAG: single-stranded-DNA-specific exonuclease RecJ [Christensenella hongkongensis]|uniref:single-stranded-DNA-specific exonuclease RecJ n=1 Tax=Christensenella hongkongensis TaxID=270498 RepID=UPI002671DC4F|nr:single-stranded-DNA-specific exonuclease RecJ [Christensenella hongkongensis]MDY3004594.1 single-stranded-DNA-specific exonuclease RecJ [Christensenella hongkongensis]
MRYILKQKEQLNTQENAVKELCGALKISKITARLLCARGICDVGQAREFLNPDISQLNDPYLFHDMRDAVSTIKHMIATGGRICVYGDYDADGISASAILYQTLIQMGANVEVFLPNRMEHGYGLSTENIKNLTDISLLITVDCGITNVEEIALAHEMGMKTIVTDHHECPHVLPRADYIINPKNPKEKYPFDSLCGAGVAFKLSQALIGDDALGMIDIAALATIADIVPLVGENRVIASLGLKRINEEPNPGIAALIKQACAKRAGEVDAQTVSFVLAPRINAAGRISTARIAFELLTEKDGNTLDRLAEELCSLNADRQQRQEKVVSEALGMQEEEGDEQDWLILLYQKDWDIGIVGLAASKVSERYTRPTILLGESEPGVYTGSARSIPGVNIYEAMSSQGKLFEKFGGHAGAAGLTLKEENLPVLRHRLNEYMKEHYNEEVFRPLKTYDLEIVPADISNSLIREFDCLRPFGFKNEQVEVLIRNARVSDIRSIGEDKHAKFLLGKGGKSVNGVIFGTQAVDVPECADAVGTLNINTYDNKPQMIVNTFSYQETAGELVRTMKKHLLGIKKAKQQDIDTYFMERDRLLQVYVVLKGISDQKISFADEGAMTAFLQKYVQGITIPNICFALLVFEEISLLDIKKNDRIHIMIRSGKRDLSESGTYQKFLLGRAHNGPEI